MGQDHRPAQRELQDRFGTRRLADRLTAGTTDVISDAHGASIEARDMFSIATTDEDGFPQCSCKGGQPGFVRVLDRSTWFDGTLPAHDPALDPSSASAPAIPRFPAVGAASEEP